MIIKSNELEYEGEQSGLRCGEEGEGGELRWSVVMCGWGGRRGRYMCVYNNHIIQLCYLLVISSITGYICMLVPQ